MVRLGWATYVSFLGLAGVALVFVAAVRLTGAMSADVANSWIKAVLLAVPAASFVLGLLFARMPGLVESARQVDAVCDTNDLYLTVTRLAQTAGQYQPLVTRDAEVLMVRENESIYLPLGCVHRMENPGRIPLTLIEVQSGSYTGEDDIVRIEDTYGRS